MPHVTELQFHKPREQDYKKWEKKLRRLNYKVSLNTRVCSNHFRYGKPLHTDNMPTLHIQSYPSWAMSVLRVRRELESLSDNVVCEVLSNMCLYAENKDLENILQGSLKERKHEINSVHDLSSLCLDLDKSLARILVHNLLSFVPVGKCMGCLAIFIHGAKIEGMNLNKFQPSEVNVKNPSTFYSSAASTKSSSINVQDVNSYCPVTAYVCPDTDHTYVLADNSRPAVNSQKMQSLHFPKPCRKRSCKRKILFLKAKVRNLQREVNRLKFQDRLRTCQRRNNADKINTNQKQSTKHQKI